MRRVPVTKTEKGRMIRHTQIINKLRHRALVTIFKFEVFPIIKREMFRYNSTRNKIHTNDVNVMPYTHISLIPLT